MIGAKAITLNAGDVLSYLTKDEQRSLSELIVRLDCIPSPAQSDKLKKYSSQGKLSADVIEAILSEEKLQPVKVTIKSDRLKSIFPLNTHSYKWKR